MRRNCRADPDGPLSCDMSHNERISPSNFSERRCLRRQVNIFGIAVVLIFAARPASAQFYAGFMGGVATLSGDAKSVIDPNVPQFSSYNATNGVVLNGFAGKHLNDFLSVQGEYAWNRNPLMLSAGSFNAGSVAEYQEDRSSSQNSVFGSVLVYFRSRQSWVRPYLSVGAGWVHLASDVKSVSVAQGAAPVPAASFSANIFGLRVPVGIDVRLRAGWRFRYSFAETISRNPISQELVPAGPHGMKNFQNLFGIVREF